MLAGQAYVTCPENTSSVVIGARDVKLGFCDGVLYTVYLHTQCYLVSDNISDIGGKRPIVRPTWYHLIEFSRDEYVNI